MAGCFVYNNFARNIRGCYRNHGETEFTIELRRRFSVSSPFQESSYKKVFTFDNFLEFLTRKRAWENLKIQCNEKLAVLGEILTKQCNFIASHRVRRMSQIWNLYSQMYSESTIKQIVSQFARNLRSHRKPLSILFSIALFSWDKERITDEEIHNFFKSDHQILEDMLYFRSSKEVCIHELDKYRSSDDHPTNPITGQKLVSNLIEEGWENVIQKECVQVWRKAFPNSYLYEYKIMGTFYDVPARTFFAVQTDIEYRKKWDKLVIKLDLVDKDEDSGCEVMHWVMHYPFPMYSREYVYIRRAVISPETNTMILVSRAIDHPCCPADNKYVRVTKYSSRMVIRPHRTYDDNGFDYVLTYFDDPKAAFPAPAYNWMAASGVPDFVEKLHEAARKLHQEKRNKSSLPLSPNDVDACPSDDLEYMYL